MTDTIVLQLDYDNILEININRKKIKNINLSISKTGEIKVSAPVRTSKKSINQFIVSKKDWLKKHYTRAQECLVQTKHAFVAGELHYYCGQPYILNIIDPKSDIAPELSLLATELISTSIYSNQFAQVEIVNNHLNIYQDKFSPLSVKYLLNKWYVAQLNKMCVELLDKWQIIIGVRATALNIKSMRSRWGTCHPVKRQITINLELIKMPVVCLEYVLVHELVHILEASHNHRFKAFMDQFLPDWRKSKQILNNFVAKNDLGMV